MRQNPIHRFGGTVRGERLCTVEDEYRPWMQLYLAVLKQAAVDARGGRKSAEQFLRDALEDDVLVQKALATKRQRPVTRQQGIAV